MTPARREPYIRRSHYYCCALRMSGSRVWSELSAVESKKEVTIIRPNNSIDPFCKQAWMEYGRRFCIYSVTGLAVGASCAFVLMGTRCDSV